MRINLLIYFILLSFFHCSAKEKELVISNSSKIIRVGPYMEILQDSTNQLSINDVSKLNGFVNYNMLIPSFGLSNDNFWARFTVKNNSDHENFTFEFNKVDILTLNLYSVNGEIYSEQKINIDDQKFSGRVFLFNTIIPKGESKTFYLEFKTKWNVTFPLQIGEKKQVLYGLFNDELINGLYVGIFLIMVFYNLFLYCSIKDKSYLYYVIYIFCFLLYQLNESGYLYKYFLYKNPYLYSVLAKLFPIITSISAIYFIRNFIQSKKYIPRLDKLYNILIVLFLCNIPLIFNSKYNGIAFLSLNILSLTAAIYAFIIGAIVIAKGFKPAIFFIIAWTVLIISISQFTLSNLGILPYYAITDHSLKIGSVIEIVLLSLGLANRINVLTKEKELSQAKSLKLAEEKKAIITQQKQRLEKLVLERTKSLELKNKTIVEQHEEKSTMMREIHHRVKNNLQMINSMIRMQARYVEDPNSSEVLSKVQRRILTMAKLHEKMYQSDNLKLIDLNDYIHNIVSDLFEIHSNEKTNYSINIDSKVTFETEIILYIGLVISELVINSLKHAFPGKDGFILIELSNRTLNAFELKISDNGIGFDVEKFNSSNSLGQRLIKSFVRQLNGELFISSNEYGSSFTINFTTN
ncbi:7TM diverse intracellular signaling domain-containing protein [Pseudofulvibacter geojedonensis]|uniref:histidine kinase n=1 Tax=Pseudofulvibacter geojedonensis TaxID=1123758 RepID=A0ABW3HYD9_9FLAO